MEPVYGVIEFCRDPGTLWEKIKSGHWDWLGVHPRGQFVLGRPKRSGVMSDYVSAKVVKPGVAELHVVRVYTEPQHEDLPASEISFATADEAREEFARKVGEFEQRDGPLLVRIVLVLDGSRAESKTVVVNASTYG